jgi:uncharacterized protein with PIN domain
MCPGCGRVFWPGTHAGDMEARIASLRRKKQEGVKP